MRKPVALIALALFCCRAPAFCAPAAGSAGAGAPPGKKPAAAVKAKKPIGDLKGITEPVGKAVSRTAEAAVKEAEVVMKEAHTLGGRFLQGLINIMIAASPGKTRVYLPAPSSNPNSGLTMGVLPVFLFVDKEETIRHILAPSITYNKIFGMTSTMRYYWYPHAGAQFFSIGSYGSEANDRVTVRYEDPRFFSDRLYFKFDATRLEEGSYKFHGTGPRSNPDRPANYNLKDNSLLVLAGVNFLERMRLVFGHRFRRADVADGPITSLPRITGILPRPAGVEDSRTVMTQQAALSYDSRDLPMAPAAGHFFSLFGEKAGHVGGSVKYERAGADLRGFYGAWANRLVTGWRLYYEGENGGEAVPFYERAILGGKDSLRGFGDARFIDNHRASLGLEERIRLYTLKAFNVNIDFEVTPFYEAGSVFSEPRGWRLSDQHHVGGLGFRTVVRPNVVGVIDVGFSDEGTALFVGIDYPF